MKHGSLFSGFGGFDLAAEWMGWHQRCKAKALKILVDYAEVMP